MSSTCPHWGGSGRVGLGVTTPGDVLAYRTMWDSFVMDTARAAQACAAAYQAAANGTGPVPTTFATPPSQATLQAFVTSYNSITTSITTSWNMHAGLQDYEIVILAASILEDFQNTVNLVGTLYQPEIRRDCPSITLPQPPSLEVQKEVISRIEGLGILAHGVLQLLGLGANGALQSYQYLWDQIPSASTLNFAIAGIVIGVIATLAGFYALNRYVLPQRR